MHNLGILYTVKSRCHVKYYFVGSENSLFHSGPHNITIYVNSDFGSASRWHCTGLSQSECIRSQRTARLPFYTTPRTHPVFMIMILPLADSFTGTMDRRPEIYAKSYGLITQETCSGVARTKNGQKHIYWMRGTLAALSALSQLRATRRSFLERATQH